MDNKWIYFIQGQATGLIKIGQSAAPGARLDQMQTGSPDRLVILGVLKYSRNLEGELHSKFADSRSHGEWYKPGPELLSFIKEFTYKY